MPKIRIPSEIKFLLLFVVVGLFIGQWVATKDPSAGEKLAGPPATANAQTSTPDVKIEEPKNCFDTAKPISTSGWPKFLFYDCNGDGYFENIKMLGRYPESTKGLFIVIVDNGELAAKLNSQKFFDTLYFHIPRDQAEEFQSAAKEILRQ